MDKFNVGDRVIGVAVMDGEDIRGMTGTVIDLWSSNIVCVRFDEPRDIFHDHLGQCEDHHGWRCLLHTIEKIQTTERCCEDLYELWEA